MFASLPEPSHMPCPDCGASLARDERESHVCDVERRLDYQVIQLHGELDGFDAELATYLASPVGRFELWYAERDRSRRKAA